MFIVNIDAFNHFTFNSLITLLFYISYRAFYVLLLKNMLKVLLASFMSIVIEKIFLLKLIFLLRFGFDTKGTL